jgi:Rps23 Pro-64 3,4-dihydroxylase Tpa1-like proline 4-hydroxylase
VSSDDDVSIVIPGPPAGPTPLTPEQIPVYFPDPPAGPTPLTPEQIPVYFPDPPVGPTPLTPAEIPVYFPDSPDEPVSEPGIQRPGQLVDPPVQFWSGDAAPLAVELPEFLAPAELDAIRSFAIANEEEFRPSAIHRDGAGVVDPDSRRSLLINARGPVERLVRDRVLEAVPYVLARLGVRPAQPRRVDVQITATGDGGFFKAHSDRSPEVSSTRRLSYVYFFHDDPSPFDGGELVLYATEHPAASLDDVGRLTVAPTQNTIVFFRSSLLHEVAPVACAGGEFRHSRFTANGWVHW